MNIPIEIAVNSDWKFCADATIECTNPQKIDKIIINKGQSFFVKNTCIDCPAGTILEALNSIKWLNGLPPLHDLTEYVEEHICDGLACVMKFHFPFASEKEIGQGGKLY
jgi:hypothetical protein